MECYKIWITLFKRTNKKSLHDLSLIHYGFQFVDCSKILGLLCFQKSKNYEK